MMRHFPSFKNVLCCLVATAIVAVCVPTNPQVHGHVTSDKTNLSVHHHVPAMATVTKNSTANPAVPPPPQAEPKKAPEPKSWGYTGPRTAKLRIRVIDGRARKPLAGAEVVVIETEQRYKTNQDGFTPWFDAPVLRNPKYRPFVAELHGQLGVIVYKNGYRDSVHLGIRMHEDIEQQATVWMYKIGPRDRRIEPVLYQEPYHHIWLIELADRFRRESQLGEGPERP